MKTREESRSVPTRSWSVPATVGAVLLCTVILLESPARIPTQRAGSDTMRDVTGVSSLLLPALPPATSADEAVAAADLAATGHPGTVAVAVTDLRTDETFTNAAGRTPLYSASLVKLISAVDVVVRSGLPVAQREAGWITRALGPSDDGAMNALWSVFDGVGALARISAAAGLTSTFPAERPSQWGETWTSAADMVALLEFVWTDLPAIDRDLLRGALAAVPPIAADRYDQAFGFFGVPGRTAVKQGWMCCQRGLITLNSAGVIGDRYLVAVLTAQPVAIGQAGARATVDAVADAIATVLADGSEVSGTAPIVAP